MDKVKLAAVQKIYSKIAELEKQKATVLPLITIFPAQVLQIDFEIRKLKQELSDIMNTVCPVLKNNK